MAGQPIRRFHLRKRANRRLWAAVAAMRNAADAVRMAGIKRLEVDQEGDKLNLVDELYFLSSEIIELFEEGGEL